jgi:hypothetical protein
MSIKSAGLIKESKSYSKKKILTCHYYSRYYNVTFAITDKLKLSRYTPWRRLRREEVQLMLILYIGTRRG